MATWLNDKCTAVSRDELEKSGNFKLLEVPTMPASHLSNRTTLMLNELLAKQAAIEVTLQEHHQTILQRLEDKYNVLSQRLEDRWAEEAAAREKEKEELLKIESTLEQVQEEELKVETELANAMIVDNEEVTQQVEVADKRQHTPWILTNRSSLVLRILHSSYFECAMAIVIFANFITMFISLQLEGLHMGHHLGLTSNDGNWEVLSGKFDLFEYVFNSVYVMELALRMYALRTKFIKDVSNIVDFCIVLSSCIDVYFLQPLDVQVVNISVLRLTRLSRVFRLAKVLRSSPMFSELRVLVRTLYIAMRGVIWSVCLLTILIVIGGVLMAQMAISYLDDQSIAKPDRIWLYDNFGTMMSATYTMFECTFTGGWRFYSRPLIYQISYVFTAFWILWVVLINFTTMRVVGALFLKETMAVSSRDHENTAMIHLNHKADHAKTLHEIFNSADQSGDGCISQKEFDQMVKSQEVLDEFGKMELHVEEVRAFFAVLASDDGQADYNEFISGALSMATSAPTLDRLKAVQQQLVLSDAVDTNKRLLEGICHKLRIDSHGLIHRPP